MYKNISDIRQEFLSFFKKKEHQIISSSSLIPDNDHTLLFTNSGMNQFKDIFLRKDIDKPLFTRVVTAQRCMRAGGKHNDLDNVGYTTRHLTFFEMLGNFSFGDYFKRESIEFAVELLTDPNWFGLSIDKLLVTVHICDIESYNIWSKEIGIPHDRVIKIGKDINDFHNSDNFWQMGDCGPCGPCSEIFYDRGNQFQGGLPGSSEDLGERYIEIWNLVFVQFDRDINNQLLPLPIASVDTGMGLERITSVLQGVSSVYSINLFANLIIDILKIIKIKNINVMNHSLRVIADHIRSCSFLIGDGVLPGNDGRDYVLRRIIRRAILHGKKLGINDVFFYKLVDPLIKNMPHLSEILQNKQDLIERTLLHEEQLFINTLKKGLELLDNRLLQLRGDVLSGEIAFDLYNTYGFPLELTQDVCFARNIKVDQMEFDQAMIRHKKSTKLNVPVIVQNNYISCDTSTLFVGYQYSRYKSQVVLLLKNGISVKSISEKEEGIVILDSTPFYGESGGQIGDSGQLKSASGCFQVMDVKKYRFNYNVIAHLGMVVDGIINIGDWVIAQIDKSRRHRISLNHSATHLLRTALINVLGSHVTQKGSLVHDQYLRFDFSHDQAMTETQINVVEKFVNQQIWNNLPITVNSMSLDIAQNSGLIVLSPKIQYDTDMVRVLNIGHISVELCGGTHSVYTGEIGLFIITKEYGVASGIRRLEAVTENMAIIAMQNKRTLLQNVAYSMQSDDKKLLNTINELKLYCHKLDKEVMYFKKQQIIQDSVSFIKNIIHIKHVKVLIKIIQDIELKLLFTIVDCLKYQLKSGIIILVNVKKNKKKHIIISVTQDLIRCNRIDALKLAYYIIDVFGGKGGGRSDLAQVGVNNTVKQPDFLMKLNSLLCNVL